MDFIKNIENDIKKIKPHEIMKARNLITSILKNFLSGPIENNGIAKCLKNLVL